MTPEMVKEAEYRTRRQALYLARGLFRRGMDIRQVSIILYARRARIYERQLAAVQRDWAKKEEG